MRNLALAALVLLACQKTPPNLRDFSGVWDTPFGYMHLVQDGEKVRGKYRSDLGSIDGRIKGDTLYFTWSDPDGSGDGFLVLSADGRSLDGAYRRGREPDWEGRWWGVRLSK
jgi:hypothetical protein